MLQEGAIDSAISVRPTLGPIQNQLGRRVGRIAIAGAIVFLLLFGALFAIGLYKGSDPLALGSLVAGSIVVVYSLVGFVRLEGEPRSFSLTPSELILDYDYPGFHRRVRVDWPKLRIRQEALLNNRVRLTIFNSVSFPRKATLDLDNETFDRAKHIIPEDVERL